MTAVKIRSSRLAAVVDDSANGNFMPGFHPSVAVLPLLDSQSTFWALFKRRQRHQRKDVSINSVLARNGNGSHTEGNYGNGTTERRNGNGKTATAAGQRKGGNQALHAHTQTRTRSFNANAVQRSIDSVIIP